MNRGVSLVTAPLLVALAVAPASAEERISERTAVSRAVDNSPALGLALLDKEAAAASVNYEDGRYPWTFVGEAGYTRTATPSLLAGGEEDVRVTQSNAIDLGAEVRKRLIWGTDLSFRTFAGWQAFDEEQPAAAGLASGSAYTFGMRFSVKQPLLRGAWSDVGEATLMQARAEAKVSEVALRRQASELVRDTLQAYWELWYAERALQIEQSALELAQRQLDDARKRVDTGGAAAADLLSFETQLSQREEQIIAADLAVSRRSAALASILGDPSASLRAAETSPPSLATPPPDASDRALRAALSIAEAEASVDVARSRVITTEDPLQPRLDVDAYVESRGIGNGSVPDAFSRFATLNAVSAHVGLTLEMPLDNRQRRAAAEMARLAVAASTTNLELTRQQVATSTLNDVREEAAARRRVELAEKTVEVAKRQVAADQARFDSGSGTAIALLQAADDLRSAELRVVRARVDVVIFNVAIAHAIDKLLVSWAVGPISKASATRRMGLAF